MCDRRIKNCLLLLIAAAMLWARPATAETSRIGTLPGKPGVAGFTMNAELDVVAGNGYQPVYL